jgi:hypothetical protein
MCALNKYLVVLHLLQFDFSKNGTRKVHQSYVVESQQFVALSWSDVVWSWCVIGKRRNWGSAD